jgi:hypothetical protein
MMAEGFPQEEVKRFFGRVWEDTIGYLRLYEFLKLKAAPLLAKRQPVTFSSIAEFWRSMLADRFVAPPSVKYQPLRDGDVVRFRRGFMTEWAPKLPGQLWTAEGVAELAKGLGSVEGIRRYGEEMYTILDPYGKLKVLNAGHGSVRLPTDTKDSDHFAYAALVEEDNWNCDYGVPIVMSRPVFDEFQRRATKGAPAIRSLEGVLRTGRDLPLSQLIPRAIGAELSKASEDSLRLSPGLPRCYVHVVSPISVNFLYNDSHPDITAWTMYSTRQSADSPWQRRSRYGFSYVTINPMIPEAHEDAATFLQQYATDHGGVRLVTDYDGVIPRLDAEIPLAKDPISAKSAVSRLLRGIDRWVKDVIDTWR